MLSGDANSIVFFTPSFGNTGSEVALFNLIIRLKGLDIIVVSRTRGALAESLPKHIKFYDYRSFYTSNKTTSLIRRIKSRVFRKRNLMDYFLDSIIKKENVVAYVNTILMPDVVRYLKAKQIKFVLHWHELDNMLTHVKQQDLLSILYAPTAIFASSASVKSLINTLGRSVDVEISYPGVDIESICSETDKSKIKESLGIDQRAFVITMSGTLDPNKNPEMFLDIGSKLTERGLNIHLLWVGVHAESAYNFFIRQKGDMLKLTKCCSWINSLTGQDYIDHLNLSDCFLLTSKQESFSIVVVEALALGKPIFSFNSGGPGEIINNHSIGRLILNYSAVEMADAIEKYIVGDISFRSEVAKERAKVFAVENVFPIWSGYLSKFLSLNLPC